MVEEIVEAKDQKGRPSMRLFIVLSVMGLACALAGCASPEEVAAADCRALGLSPGTEAYVSCVMQDRYGARTPIPLNGVTPQVSLPPMPQAGSAGRAVLSAIPGL